MAGRIRIKAVEKAGTVTVKALIKHPMETGNRKEGQWGTGIAKNPYMSLQYYGKKGDIVNLKLLDNKNNNFFVETVVK